MILILFSFCEPVDTILQNATPEELANILACEKKLLAKRPQR